MRRRRSRYASWISIAGYVRTGCGNSGRHIRLQQDAHFPFHSRLALADAEFSVSDGNPDDRSQLVVATALQVIGALLRIDCDSAVERSQGDDEVDDRQSGWN